MHEAEPVSAASLRQALANRASCVAATRFASASLFPSYS
ncbi:flavin reductase [Pseudomonas protegens]|nr:flavin reductase [Pseudomonas protegens]